VAATGGYGTPPIATPASGHARLGRHPPPSLYLGDSAAGTANPATGDLVLKTRIEGRRRGSASSLGLDRLTDRVTALQRVWSTADQLSGKIEAAHAHQWVLASPAWVLAQRSVRP
jgi:hypothetical protein